ncbi:MAG: hypothetical protein IJ725_04285, partial [Ruminococcus sp.]|nr:hypothetical protein [Ruminococcus sp.]
MTLLELSAKELSDISGLSEALLSRYRSGQRTPSLDGEAYQKIIDGLCSAAESKNIQLNRDELSARLSESIKNRGIEANELADNLNTLIDTFNIKAADIAQAINYEPAQLSRIRSKKRRPTKP